MSAGRELVGSLSEADQRAIHEALRASVDGPFFVYFWACPSGDAEEDRRWLARGPHHCLTTPEDVRRRGAVDWWEFHAIFGLQPEDVRRIADAWPTFDGVDPEDVDLAINNALNNLTGFPHRCEGVWGQYLSVDCDELLAVFRRWRAKRGA